MTSVRTGRGYCRTHKLGILENSQVGISVNSQFKVFISEISCFNFKMETHGLSLEYLSLV